MGLRRSAESERGEGAGLYEQKRNDHEGAEQLRLAEYSTPDWAQDVHMGWLVRG